jgi:XTP/dITP diphosphohydrolase
MTNLLLATANRGKISELQAMLGRSARVLSLADLDLASPEETGQTFEDNAELKARHGALASGLVTVADDSGIEVDALDGAPGVRSARYAGESGDDARNREKLLAALAGTPPEGRAARFVSVIAVATPTGETRLFRGTLDGRVAGAARGTGGFGYDSVLELPDGRTVAELSQEQKNAISHRGTALRLALPYLHQLLNARPDGPEGTL